MVGGLAWGLYVGFGMNANTETAGTLNEYLVAIEAYDLGRWWTIEKRRVSAESEAQAVELLKVRGVCGRVGKAERIRSEAEIDAMLAE